MRVLYVAAEASNWVINLCNEMAKLGHKVTCVAQKEDGYNKDSFIELHSNLKIIHTDTMEEFFTPNVIKNKVLPEYASNGFDLVFGSHAPISPIVYDIARAFNIPYGFMLLDIPTDLIQQQRFRMKQWQLWFDSMKHADAMVFNTFVSRDEYYDFTHQYFPDKNVIPYAINTLPEYDMAGVDIKGDYALSVFRLTTVKNGLSIAKAIGLMDRKIKYVAIGRDCGQLRDIKGFCDFNGIEFVHYANVSEKDKFELIKNCSFMVYPQMTEYIAGLSPLEAMYVGKPVITTDFKVLKDLYKDYVFYYDKSLINLAEKMSFAGNMNKRAFKDVFVNANKYVKEEATFPIMARRLLTIMEGMIR